jgi:hypothetical protein
MNPMFSIPLSWSFLFDLLPARPYRSCFGAKVNFVEWRINMKTLTAAFTGIASLVGTDVALAQGQMMQGGMWGDDWMGGYGGPWGGNIAHCGHCRLRCVDRPA